MGDRPIRVEAFTPEREWQIWLRNLRPPSLTLDEAVPSSARVVAVAPHPDDEVLACGGLLARHAERGGLVAIVAVTDGEASHQADADWPPLRLAPARRAERQAGLKRLGVSVDTITSLAVPDGSVAAFGVDLEDALRRVLRSDDTVVTTWQGDGHPDHEATGSATASACEAVGCRLLEAPVWMWHWSGPDDPRVPWHRLRALALPSDALARKTAALRAHETQLSPRVGGTAVLGPEVLARAARDTEYLFV
ncbi:PIG-L deacetylase family protein [Rhizobacter fulvus]